MSLYALCSDMHASAWKQCYWFNIVWWIIQITWSTVPDITLNYHKDHALNKDVTEIPTIHNKTTIVWQLLKFTNYSKLKPWKKLTQNHHPHFWKRIYNLVDSMHSWNRLTLPDRRVWVVWSDMEYLHRQYSILFLFLPSRRKEKSREVPTMTVYN